MARLLASLRLLVGCFQFSRKAGGRQDLLPYANHFLLGMIPWSSWPFFEAGEGSIQTGLVLWCPLNAGLLQVWAGSPTLPQWKPAKHQSSGLSLLFSPCSPSCACGQLAQGTNEPSPDVRSWFSLAFHFYPFDLIDSMSAWLGYSLLVIVL